MHKPLIAALAAPFATAVLAAVVLVAREPAAALASEAIHLTASVTSTRVAAAIEGTWTLTPTRTDGRLQLNLSYENNANWGRGIDRADLAGLSDEVLNATTSTPAAFRIQREAGVFDMEGAFREQRGAGHFRFTPDRAFAGTLRSLGVQGADRATDRELMTLAMADASIANVRGLMGMDLGPIDLEKLVELAIFNVTPEYVREMRSLGIGGTNSVRGVVELRIHGISTAYVRELESIGYRDLDREQLLAMGIHGVTAESVRELQALGYRDLPARDLVAMHIHGVTPAYIRELREAGFRDLTPEAMVEMRIHSVTPRFVRDLKALGYRDLTRRQLLDMGIHGVTPAFIREIREADFKDLTPETLVNMKIHGIGADYVRTRRRGE
ncbi:hypothetical protein [Longimicrobium sp.]|uniref:hypothetical protein n=1 Tax=Longimicrobium sp. TaxID=2029185 RepID=UPI003B3B0395